MEEAQNSKTNDTDDEIAHSASTSAHGGSHIKLTDDTQQNTDNHLPLDQLAPKTNKRSS
jgi:hypothetical protein